MAAKKSLHEMTTEELGQLFPVILQQYDPVWADLFKSEIESITSLFKPSEIISIEHIGSTAIPDIMSKPVIDILIEVSDGMDNNRLVQIFKSKGYEYISKPENPAPHMMFVKGYTIHGNIGQVYHVHIRYKGRWDEIIFRDYLLNNSLLAKEYEKLKIHLAEKHKYDREAYTQEKNDFIEKINKMARSDIKYDIVELSQRPDLIDSAVKFFWKCWGNENNFKFYEDCIINSLDTDVPLPKFYLALDNTDNIIGTYALLTNDLISRQDLMPWFACLFVKEEHRNKGIATSLLEHGLNETIKKGFDKLYLYTDLENFYERKGWKHIFNGYNVANMEVKIYAKDTL